MLTNDEVLKDLFNPLDVSQVNAASKQLIYSQFTWTQDVYTLEKVSVPKLVTEVRERLQVTKEFLDKQKQTLPLIYERSGDASKPEARELKPKITSDVLYLKKKRIEKVKSTDNLDYSLRTEENNKPPPSKLLNSKSHQAHFKLKRDLETIDQLSRSFNQDDSVQAFITEQLKEVRSKKYFNPDRYEEESRRLFNTTTILSKSTLKKSQELQARITSSFVKYNPSKGSSTTYALETAANVKRTKYVASQKPKPKPKTMMMRLKTLVKAQSKLKLAKAQGVPFSLLHTLTSS
jgi:hypothetical protein